MLGLLLEAGVTESLLEGNALDQLGLSHGTAGDLLDAHKLNIAHIGVKVSDGVHHHGGEQVLLTSNKLGVEGSAGALLQQRAELHTVLLGDADLLDLGKGNVTRLSKALDNNSGVKAILDEVLALLQYLSSQQYDGSSTITNLSVLKGIRKKKVRVQSPSSAVRSALFRT